MSRSDVDSNSDNDTINNATGMITPTPPGLVTPSAIEIIRLSVPSSWIISDNRGQHYKTMMSKMKKISTLTHLVADGQTGFTMPSVDDVTNTGLNVPGGILELQHWKGTNRRFDLQNYGKTFKTIIDACTSIGYWEDDDWKQFAGVLYTGGGRSVWNRCDLNEDYMNSMTKGNMSLLRIILHSNNI